MNFNKVSRLVGRSSLLLKKNSPQILFVSGIVGVVATTVLASRATLKSVEPVNKLKESRAALDTVASASEMDKDLYTKSVAEQYVDTSISLVKNYAPVIVVGGLSIIALTKSHQQLTSRNAALTAAYSGLFKTFEMYRNRVRMAHGDAADRHYLHGTETKLIEVRDQDGNIEVKEISGPDPKSVAALTHYFDANTASWCKDPTYNQTFLDNQMKWANILLQKQGHMFLNEVYDLLQIPHTRDGNILGWVYEDLGDNDMHIDFGHHKDGEFVAGFKRDVMLEFNIHGPILDLI